MVGSLPGGAVTFLGAVLLGCLSIALASDRNRIRAERAACQEDLDGLRRFQWWLQRVELLDDPTERSRTRIAMLHECAGICRVVQTPVGYL